MIERHRQARNPIEVAAVVACGVSGMMQILSRSTPAVMADFVSRPYQVGWSWLLLLGALTALVGIAIRDEVSGCYLEVVGLLGVGGANIAYGSAVLLASPNPSGSLAGPFAIGFGIACVIRSTMVTRTIYLVQKRRNEALIAEVKHQASEIVDRGSDAIIEWRREQDGGNG